MIINRLGIDLSHYNGPCDYGLIWAAGVRLIWHKASESIGAPDDKYAQRMKDIKASGHPFLRAAYHFGRGTSVDAQLSDFFKYAQPEPDMAMALDWEVASMTTPMARDFLAKCDAKWGKTTCLYSYLSFLKEHLGDTPDTFFGLHPLWLAAYTDKPFTPQASWNKYFLFQYSDGVNGPQPHMCPGVTGDCDENSFDGSEADLRAEWAGWMATGNPHIPVIAPPPPLVPQTIYNGDRKPVFDVVRPFVVGGQLAQRQVNQLDAVLNGWVDDGTSRKTFFDLVRDMTSYGRFTQNQVDQLDAVLTAWETPKPVVLHANNVVAAAGLAPTL